MTATIIAVQKHFAKNALRKHPFTKTEACSAGTSNQSKQSSGDDPGASACRRARVSLWWKAETSLSLTSPYTPIRAASSQQPWAHSHITWFDKLHWPSAQLPIRIYKAQRLFDNFSLSKRVVRSLSKRVVMVQNGEINICFKHTCIIFLFAISPEAKLTALK